MSTTASAYFELAVRRKWRFPYKGLISVEDLWDLPLEELDKVFKALNAEAKVVGEESLLTNKSTEDAELDAKILIVRYIASVKDAEKEAATRAAENKAKKQQILSIIANKQNEALQNSSIEELTKMLEELN